MIKISSDIPFDTAIEEAANRFVDWNFFEVTKVETTDNGEINYVNLLNKNKKMVRSIEIIINANSAIVNGLD